MILDVGLPDGNGFDLLRRIRVESDVPVIMLTAQADVDDRVRGLNLGADDYIAKRKFELLELLIRNPRQVLSKETILDRLWGYTFDDNLVEVYILPAEPLRFSTHSALWSADRAPRLRRYDYE